MYAHAPGVPICFKADSGQQTAVGRQRTAVSMGWALTADRRPPTA